MANIKILSGNPDMLTIELTQECCQLIRIPYEIYYLSWNHPDLKTRLLSINYRTDVVIFVIEDAVTGTNEFNWHTETKLPGPADLQEICAAFPDKQFIVFSRCYKLQDFCTQENLSIIDLPPQHLSTIDRYKTCQTKNFTSNRHWIFINYTTSFMKTTALSYAVANQLEQFGEIVINHDILNHFIKWKNFYHAVNYQMPAMDRTFLDVGWQKLMEFSTIGQVEEIYSQRNTLIGIADNYNTFLLPRHENSFLEVIASTSFQEPTIYLTEKNWENIFAKNFPLLLANAGTVEFLENLGIDMFSDIVDHSYDNVLDPYLRIKTLFDCNTELFNNPKHVKQLWKQHELRFNDNINRLDVISLQFKDQCRSQFHQLTSKINI